MIYVCLFDWISLLFIRFVFYISSIVIFYREEYMGEDLNINRFILLVVIFVTSIILIIISPNLIRILIGWDGLGLVSYCLVIYYQNVKRFNAGILTALSNRIGDVALLLRISWILNYGSWNFIFYIEIIKRDFIIQVICFFVMVASLTKRAQIPFSSWLPAAIAAPTPVSSLVHSSTLVTAGVYLLIRFNDAFSAELINILLFISVITIFMSGLGANFEFDLKKIIALSTLSQLGLIIRILSMGRYNLAFFHLLIHALFKALLFICAGNIIHNLNNCQDIRYMGGLIKLIPLTCTYINLCNWSLCGLPFISGFYSKDLIVEIISINIINSFIYILFYISIGLTVSYSFRLSYYTITGNFNFFSLNLIRDLRKKILFRMRGIIFFVIIRGRVFSWLIFFNLFFICLPIYMKLITLLIILIGIFIGYELSNFKIFYSLLRNNSRGAFMASIWNLPFLSTIGINYYPLSLGSIFLKTIDQGWMEYYGGQNLSWLVFNRGKLQILSINHLKIYLLILLIWIFFIILIIYLNSLYLEHDIEDIREVYYF